MESDLRKLHSTTKTVEAQQIEQPLLDMYRDELDNLSLQATLLLGFAVAFLSAETLAGFFDGESSFCVYKTRSHMVAGVAFVVFAAACISLCLLVICFSFYIHFKARHAYYRIGTMVQSVTRENAALVEMWYVSSLITFVISVISTMWIALGLPHFVEVTPDSTQAFWLADDDMWQTHAGRTLQRCLNRHDEADLLLRDWRAPPPAPTSELGVPLRPLTAAHHRHHPPQVWRRARRRLVAHVRRVHGVRRHQILRRPLRVPRRLPRPADRQARPHVQKDEGRAEGRAHEGVHALAGAAGTREGPTGSEETLR